MESYSRTDTENKSPPWVVIADANPTRGQAVAELLAEAGFPLDRNHLETTAASAIAAIAEKNGAVFFLDDSIGIGALREVHARLTEKWGSNGFFLFVITGGEAADFSEFAAEARVDGLIYRPYRREDFLSRVSHVFNEKWANRTEKSEEPSEALVSMSGDSGIFNLAVEKENRLGARDTLTADPKLAPQIGLARIEQPGVTEGAASFEKVRLTFRAVARNGEALRKPLPAHALEIDESSATFECAALDWESEDNITFEAEISHATETHLLRIEARLSGAPQQGIVTVEFDEGNRARFDVASRMVSKRFAELKEFFKYAKGA